MKIAVLSNVIKSNPTEAARAFLEVVADDCEVFVAKELSGIIPAKEYYDDETLFRLADVAVVFGGDGTTLTASRRAAPYNVPVLSINTGHLGFLATVAAKDAKKAAECLLKNNLALSERIMLNVRVVREEKVVFEALALNDITARRISGKLADIEVSHNESYVADYRADGVVIATPTGSTAYSLSCGGPVVMPELDVFVVSPICPHFLGARPLIIPTDGTVELKFASDFGSASISADGQSEFEVTAGDKVVISKSQLTAKLLTLKEQNFFNLVRQKLTLD
ncbi:MAG: NAD(+)/NADH kinase [Clostridia bacterium]|nr:NAD(+)/NADH kinase [Clostridia bacterium]